ncbi:L-threonylcarbamoyladenylate synthase [Flavisolibacter tropicus]|uniref:L-threonylcarbamoyladenylate synthase n=1 Tax=Flavisolibacter tropicus TaxID=1492898 RepID=A0A172U185_9BACT|nr:L-threonylcarbamoyladenylate synthase [Flavisolibacter tropicus]ANE53080.1 translation factor Sua5 [Flavisolibacter tropicus]
MAEFFEDDIKRAIDVMQRGGVILYPTDTIWGLGCDATNEQAIKRIYEIKQRDDSKSLIVLMAEEKDVLQYVAAPDLAVFDFLEEQERPTTIVYEHAVGLPHNLVATDGSIGIRLTQDLFCRHLIKRFKKPIVSTSANISGEPSPQTFGDISPAIKEQVDYIVSWRQDDVAPALPSQIIKWNNDGTRIVIRS